MSKGRRRNRTAQQAGPGESKQDRETFDSLFYDVCAVIESYGLNPHTWMIELMQACEDSGGHLPNDDRFMPWNMTPADRVRLSQPRPFQVGDKIYESEHGRIFELDGAGNRKGVCGGSLIEAEEQMASNCAVRPAQFHSEVFTKPLPLRPIDHFKKSLPMRASMAWRDAESGVN